MVILFASSIGWIIVGCIALVLILIALISSIVVVRQTEAFIVERIGKYRATLDVGFHLIAPFFDRVVKKVSLKEHVADFKPQPVITKDNVTIQIDTVVYYQITDAKLFTYGVSNPMSAIENLTATTLRNIIGELELDATLTSRDVINVLFPIIDSFRFAKSTKLILPSELTSITSLTAAAVETINTMKNKEEKK